MNKNSPKKICIICEGFEEFDYINRLIECNVFNPIYTFTVKNARGIDGIAPLYQNAFQNDDYDLIVAFCDTEAPPYYQYRNILKKINRFHGSNVAKYIVYFTNPCSMQVVLSHFGSVALETNSKSGNAPLIKRLTGVRAYSADHSQRAAMMRKINAVNYMLMKQNIAAMSTDFRMCPSTNFLSLLLKLESSNSTWVDKIVSKLERD